MKEIKTKPNGKKMIDRNRILSTLSALPFEGKKKWQTILKVKIKMEMICDYVDHMYGYVPFKFAPFDSYESCQCFTGGGRVHVL